MSLDRFNDLNRQGFMNPRKPKTAKKAVKIMACDGCMDWHREGEHILSAAERRINTQRFK